MATRWTIVDATGSPLPAGFTCSLLGDGRVLATGTTDSGGSVDFAAESMGAERLALRIDRAPLGGELSGTLDRGKQHR